MPYLNCNFCDFTVQTPEQNLKKRTIDSVSNDGGGSADDNEKKFKIKRIEWDLEEKAKPAASSKTALNARPPLTTNAIRSRSQQPDGLSKENAQLRQHTPKPHEAGGHLPEPIPVGTAGARARLAIPPDHPQYPQQNPNGRSVMGRLQRPPPGGPQARAVHEEIPEQMMDEREKRPIPVFENNGFVAGQGGAGASGPLRAQARPHPGNAGYGMAGMEGGAGGPGFGGYPQQQQQQQQGRAGFQPYNNGPNFQRGRRGGAGNLGGPGHMVNAGMGAAGMGGTGDGVFYPRMGMMGGGMMPMQNMQNAFYVEPGFGPMGGGFAGGQQWA
ncbi:hypothetical protein HK101_003437, partial [Irineochytrium annulatum]